MEEKKELSTKEKRTLMIVSLAIVIALVFGVSYAYFMAVGQSDEQTITTANLTMGFTNGDIVRATDISPISDNEIKTSATELPFSVTNTSNQHMKITVKLTDITIADDLKDIDFRWGLYNADTNLGVSFGIFKYATTGSEEILLQDVILDQGSDTKNYILRVWIHDDGALQNEMMGETFSGKVTVTGEGVEYTDESCFVFDSSTGTIENYDVELDENGDVVLDEYYYQPIHRNICPKDIVIPKTIGGITVTKLGSGAFADSDMSHSSIKLNSIIIPDTVTTINEGVIYDSANDNTLSHITIPESVTTIGSGINSVVTIFSTPNLKSITIPENVVNINGDLGVSNVTKPLIISIPNLIDYSFMGANTDLILMEGVTHIGLRALGACGFSTIEIPSSITSIASGAFDSCSNLTEIVVRGKSSLADFTDSTGLTTDGVLPEGVTITFRP